MKARLTLLSFILVLLTRIVNAQTGHAPEVSQWLRYTVKGEEFSVSLPAVPAMMTDEVAYSWPSTKMRIERMLMTTADGVLYAIYTRENKAQQSLADFITEQTAMRKPGTTEERAVEINGFAGRQQTPVDKNKHTIELFFATKEHLYQFHVNGGDENHAGVKQFLSSIMLTKKPEGIEVSDGPGAPEENPPDEQIYSRKNVDTRAQILYKRPPQYSEEARKHRITGTVILKVVLSSTGQVTHVTVVSGLPHGLTERSIAAARLIEFVPAMKDGKPVSVWMDLEFSFNLY
jgi:TonB family protein